MKDRSSSVDTSPEPWYWKIKQSVLIEHKNMRLSYTYVMNTELKRKLYYFAVTPAILFRVKTQCLFTKMQIKNTL